MLGDSHLHDASPVHRRDGHINATEGIIESEATSGLPKMSELGVPQMMRTRRKNCALR